MLKRKTKKKEENELFQKTWQRAYFTKRLCQPLKCLTSVFGMGTGVTTSLSPPDHIQDVP